MAQDYTVTKILKDETWDGNDDKMRTTELLLDGHSGAVKLIGKARFEAPEEGKQVYGEIDGDRFRPRRRPETTSNGAGGASYDDTRQRSIIRQHSQEMALRFLAGCGGAPVAGIEDVEGTKKSLTYVERLTDWFEKDAQGDRRPSQPSLPAAEPQKSDEDIPF